jgi:ubiquinone/menaquinone biosynthesis C-methylase UbiE
MKDKKDGEIKKAVREGYAEVAKNKSSCCGPSETCGTGDDKATNISRKVGYSEGEIGSAPEGSNLGLGCGNPTAMASLKEGETVLDLGSGAGFDCFLAANKVGKNGKVIGVDMTPEMLDKARENAKKGGYENVEFRLGEIENLPAADNSVDVVISNCVINLSPDKKSVYGEAFRVLKPGGRIMVSDIVLTKELPREILDSIEAYVGCISGALLKDDYLQTVRDAGFKDVKVLDEKSFSLELFVNDPTAKAIIDKLDVTEKDIKDFETTVLSISVEARK